MSTRRRGTEEEARALNAFVTLMRCSKFLLARLSGGLRESGLTPSPFGTLEVLYHRGPLSQCEIARKILRTSGNMTMVVDNLEKRGLVRRERNAEDRRLSTVHLTERGVPRRKGVPPTSTRHRRGNEHLNSSGTGRASSSLSHPWQARAQRVIHFYFYCSTSSRLT